MYADDLFLSANESGTSSEGSFCSMDNNLGDSLRGAFLGNLKQTFNACHLNAQSIPSHHSELYDTFYNNSNVHAILISESWLKPHLLSTSYSLPGYILLRNDRLGKPGGGVAVYLRSDLSYKVISSSSSNYTGSAEYLFIEVWLKGAKIVIGVVYCPPTIDYFTEFESVLESVGSNYAHHIIMGDLNTNLLAPDSSRSKRLLRLIEAVNMHVMPLSATHHNLVGDDTWLDIVLTSNPLLVSSHGQYDAPGFSHHDLIFASYELLPPKLKPKVMYRRCFKRLNLDNLHDEASRIDWEPLYQATTIDGKLTLFNGIIHKLYDTHAPVKKVKVKHSPAPWMSRGIKMAMRRRNRAFNIYKKFRSEENWSLFKVARNRCNRMIRDAKSRHILNNISSSTSSAEMWKFLRSLGIGKTRNDIFPSTIGPDELNRYFSSSSPLDRLTIDSTVSYIASLEKPDIDPFRFSPICPGDTKKAIISFKSKAMGCDNISRHMIIPILDHILLPLTHIINSSLEYGDFPSLWRKAYVRPMAKISNPSLPCHYRPISILPFLSKILEACVHRQFSNFIHHNSLVSQFQSGFKPGHSTTTALLKVTGDVRAGMEESKISVMALIDFSNAFNTVSHDILLSILSHIQVAPEALKWFASYLRGRQQSVIIDDLTSNPCDVDTGVPQGGILSPLLFSIFIDLLTLELRCPYHLYADDLQIYTQAGVDELSVAISKLNCDLAAVEAWSQKYGLSVNPSKCQAIIIGSRQNMKKIDYQLLPAITMCSYTIPYSSDVKDLGIYIDNTLSWIPHVNSVSQKVTGVLRYLYPLKNMLPLSVKVALVQSLILPIIDYGDVCFFDLNADLLNKLDRLLNNCIRFVFSLRKFDHVSERRRTLNWLPIRQRRELRALTTLFSILFTPHSPEYLKSCFRYLCSSHEKELRSSNNRLLECPIHHSDFIHSSFLVQAIMLWNALPQEIRMAQSRLTFKRKLREHLLESCSGIPPH